MKGAVGMFGSLVIGEEQAAHEAEVVKVSGHVFGPLVLGDRHGSEVTDVPIKEQKPPTMDFDPRQIWRVKQGDLAKLTRELENPSILRLWRATEVENPRGARDVVLRAIDARLTEIEGPRKPAAAPVPEAKAEPAAEVRAIDLPPEPLRDILPDESEPVIDAEEESRG